VVLAHLFWKSMGKKYSPCMHVYTHTHTHTHTHTERKHLAISGSRYREAWLTMGWCPWNRRTFPKDIEQIASWLLANSEMSPSEKEAAVVCKGVWVFTPSAPHGERSWLEEFDLIKYEFFLMVQCFYIEYLVMPKNCDTSKREVSFSYKYTPY
jgi:hypothetical protein